MAALHPDQEHPDMTFVKTLNRSLNLIHVSHRRSDGPMVHLKVIEGSIMIPDYSPILNQSIHERHVRGFLIWMQSSHLRQVSLELLSRVRGIHSETIVGLPVHTPVKIKPGAFTIRHTLQKVSTGMVKNDGRVVSSTGSLKKYPGEIFLTWLPKQ